MERLAKLGDPSSCDSEATAAVAAKAALPPFVCWLRNLRWGVGLRLRYFPEFGDKL